MDKGTQPAGSSTRFEILTRLGQGGMGVVYRAFDRERGVEVALKTLASADPDSIYRLKREFRSLADLSHPNLCSLHELLFENGMWFFTMELVKGTSFSDYVWRRDPTAEPTRHGPVKPSHDTAATRVKPVGPPTEPAGQGQVPRSEAPTRMRAASFPPEGPAQEAMPEHVDVDLGTFTVLYGNAPAAPAPAPAPAQAPAPAPDPAPPAPAASPQPIPLVELVTSTIHYGGNAPAAPEQLPPPPVQLSTSTQHYGGSASGPFQPILLVQEVAPAAAPAAPAPSGAAPPAEPAAPLLRKRPTYDPERLTSALKQLVRGVQYLHQSGKQHRDLKPANVMVTEEGRVVLLDFGLALERQKEDFIRDEPEDHASGTPAYMAPERHAGRPSTEASDWYSVGVMLYEALTGRRPFTHLGVFQGKPVSPPSPKDLVRDLPDHLVDLCMRLLSWEPAQRPSGNEILRALGDEPAAAPELPAAASPVSQVFVGREAHLKALEQAFTDLRASGPILVRVQGTSGFGKTALVRHFLGKLHDSRQAVVLAGRCYERESMPYKVFDALVDSLSRYLSTLPRLEATALMPRDIHVLAKLFPSLMRVEPVVNAPRRNVESKDAYELQRRASAALKELLGRIADRFPLVLFVDDLHWGDLDSARLLGDLVVPPDPPRALLVVSYRSEELESNHVLRTLLQAAQAGGSQVQSREILVGPLTTDESRQLAVKVLGSAGAAEAPAGAIIQEAAGSPFFVQELARYLSGAPGATASGKIGVSLADVLKARIDRLPPPARQLLEAVAVAGRPLSQQIATQCAGLTQKPEEAVFALRAASLVRLSGPRVTDTIEVYHDRIRESVMSGLPPSRVIAQHRTIAEVLERVEPVDAEALLAHWQAAGEPSRAVKYASLAAERAAAALAFDRAAQMYQLALELMPPSDGGRQHARVQLAHALRNAGRGRDSARAYMAAASGAATESERLELKRQAMEQFLVSGYMDQGRSVAKAVLASVGLKMPSTPTGVVASLLLQRARVTLRGLKFKERTEAEVPEALLHRIDTCWSMSTGLSVIDTKLGSDFTTRFLRYSLDGGEIGRVSRALVLEAAHQCTTGNFARADKLVATAAELARRCASDHVSAFCSLMTGWVEYFKGHYQAALDHFDGSAPVFREKCVGANWEISTADMMANWSLGYLGEWAELARRGPGLLKAAEGSGNLYRLDSLSISYGVFSGLRVDEVDRVRSQMREAARRWTPSGFQVQHYFRLLMAGFVDLYAGEAEAGWKRLREQWPALRGSLLLTVEDVRFRMFLLNGFTAVACGDAPPLRRAARKAISVLNKIHADGAKGAAEVMGASLAHREGKDEVAAEKLRRAIEDFQRAGMTLFAAAARWRLGQLTASREGQTMVEQGRRVMERQGIRRPERVLRMFAPGFPEA
jgi:hypothetical protein